MSDGNSAPPSEAVAAARSYARVADGAEDMLLAGMTATAIALAEAFLGQALLVRGFADTVAADGRWQPLAMAPVVSIDSIDLPLGEYATDIGADGRGWVRARSGSPVRVAYVAGLAMDWGHVPAPIAQGVAMLAAHLFDAGEGAAPPAAVSALWRPWRRMRL